MITEEQEQQLDTKHDFNLPDHGNELSKAEDLIDKLKNRFKLIQTQRCINDKNHEEIFETIMNLLFYVGDLSKCVFDIGDSIEELYFKRYKKTPELAKALWLEHYGRLHRPYNVLKNRCYRLLDELDAEYFKRHKKRPPNWGKNKNSY